MNLNTLRFGEIVIAEEEIITFHVGLPGFENLHQFVLIKPDEQIPFSFIQSVEDGNTAFIVTNPFIFYTDYEFELSEEYKEELKIQEDEDVMIWSILNIRESLDDATLNLLGPIIINVREKLGKQIILQGTAYKTKHQLIVLEAAESATERGDTKC